MAITIVCSDCGHAKRSEDGDEETCPKCEGTMAPPKKKVAAKADDTKSAKKKPARDEDDEDEKPAARKKPQPIPDDDDEDERPKAKKKPPRDEDDEDEDDKPRAKGKKKSRDDDDDKGEGYILNPEPAENLELRTGFKNSKLMDQVTDELSRGETLFWAARMCPQIVEQKAKVLMFVGIGVAVVGCVFSGIVFAVAPWFAGLIPLIFVLVGVLMAALLPGATRKAAAQSWYAVTDQRAIVFSAGLFGSQGKSESYEPDELRRMRVKPAKRPKGAGDLIFKTKITEQRTDYVDRKTGRTVRSETSRHETHYGFLGIEDVREVEALIHKVLLSDEDDDEDEKPRTKRRDDDE